MPLSKYPPEVQKLAGIAADLSTPEWPNYADLGITTEHIPALINIVRDSPNFWNDEVDEELFLVPMHASRALAQMQAVEALPDLLDALRWIEEEDMDLVAEDMPDVLAAFGPAAGPAVIAYLKDPDHHLWARVAALEAFNYIALNHPGFRQQAVDAVTQVLERYEDNDPILNGDIIGVLTDLKAVKAAPIVEQAFAAGRVDLSITGDWEDFQVAVGLLEERITPPQPNPLFETGFADGVTEEERAERSAERKREKKEKEKRKQAKSSRKAARHKKKK